MKLLEKYQQKLSFKIIIVLLITFITSMLIMRHYAYVLEVDNLKILDLRLSYTQKQVVYYLIKMGEDGRAYYSNVFFMLMLFI